ncbi:tailspike protein [Arthrobacter phage MamaPearl]|uniref:Tailspike protein n=1 Tax=Arthrobacter phage MamaPearl TaxID=2743906 RepID=A0AAE7F714_9CAUD|nr:tail protein [Arthrobacter phage MamaPearl]QDH48211.1 minor tail protein [Arthrobacter phage EstebanJulior]QKY79093.1 tailspike protein [Arthrobacter phage MamaPearl]
MVNILDFGAPTRANFLTALASGAKNLYFPEGTYDYSGTAINIDRAITFRGDGPEATTIQLTEGFRTNTGGLDVEGITFAAKTTSSNNIAFKTTFAGLGVQFDISGFKFHNCHFVGFFYSTYLAGGTYAAASDPTFVPAGYVTRIKITNCESFAPATGNAGHFQHILTRDVHISGCSTYGGAGATSYNFIGNNGYLRVLGNYDNFNSYGSCEVENNSGSAIVSGNHFGSDIWIDDSNNVNVSDNVVERDILVSIQNFNVQNVKVLGNHAARIRVIKFGTTQTNPLVMDAILIADNHLNGVGTYGIFVQDDQNRIKRVDIKGNFITGNYSSGSIGVVKYANMYCQVRDNWLINTGVIGVVVSGSAGTVTQTGNV